MTDMCPGCGGRGFSVSLNTMLPCGRCHGTGMVDLDAEIVARRDADVRAMNAAIGDAAALMRRLGDG